jgi:hypothetical protein
VHAKDVSDLHAELGRQKLLPAIQASVVDVQTQDRHESAGKRSPLTIRTVGEILAMSFNTPTWSYGMAISHSASALQSAAWVASENRG